MNYARMAKVLVGGLLGGAAGYGAYYIWQKKPWKKEQGEVVYEAPKNEDEWREGKTVADEVVEEAVDELVQSVEEMQEVKSIVENYIPSKNGGWRQIVGEAQPTSYDSEYVYYAEDEMLVDADMEEVDDNLFQAVLQAHSIAPNEKQLFFMDADTLDCARVNVTNEDYAESYNRFMDAKFEVGDVLYPEEE